MGSKFEIMSKMENGNESIGGARAPAFEVICRRSYV
jgi:hypothetical protein